MADFEAMRQRAKELDAAWEVAHKANHDGGPVVDRALREGFVPTRPEPPEMFWHLRELERRRGQKQRIECARKDMKEAGVDFDRVLRLFDECG